MSNEKKNKKPSVSFWRKWFSRDKTKRSSLGNVIHNTRLYGFIIIVVEVVYYLVYVILFYTVPGFKESFFARQTTLLVNLLAFLMIDVVFVWSRLNLISANSHRTELGVASILGQDTKEAFEFSNLGMAMIDENNIVIWVNEYLMNKQVNMLDTNIYERFENLIGLENRNTVNVKINNMVYSVLYIKESSLFLFKDITDYEEEHAFALKEAVVVGKLVIDTYDELSKSMESRRFDEMLLKTTKTIETYFDKYGALLLLGEDEDEYNIICNFESFNKMREDGFSILDEVKSTSRDDKSMMMTISVGFANGFNENILSLFEKSSSSCSNALKRGGDQVIVSDAEGQHVFGGTSKIQRQQDLVKYRTIAQTLSSLIRESSNVIISGHKNADLDALGSALGFYAFAKTVKRNNGEFIPVKIVFDSNDAQSNAAAVYQKLHSGHFRKTFITPSEANNNIDENTLVIFTDVHNPMASLLSRNFDKENDLTIPNRVIVFDHHVKNAADLEIDTLLELSDPSISSASEMITHLLQYTEEKPDLGFTIADVLLGGIMLDTSFFKNRVVNTTFNACNLLIQQGADPNNASNMLKEAYETYQLKCLIGATDGETSDNFYLKNGAHIFIVCAYDPKNPGAALDKDILAKVADEHIATRDVDACFVIGKTGDGQFYVSCRGNGKYNVQKVAEGFKDGFGGGEFDRAAVAFNNKDLSVEIIRDKIHDKIDEIADLYDED
ncbi:MAG: DHH family phosphoesterase [Bacilli bacterium]|nr:DHH family phosphoesterase [Bacilli bacterium]